MCQAETIGTPTRQDGKAPRWVVMRRRITQGPAVAEPRLLEGVCGAPWPTPKSGRIFLLRSCHLWPPGLRRVEAALRDTPWTSPSKNILTGLMEIWVPDTVCLESQPPTASTRTSLAIEPRETTKLITFLLNYLSLLLTKICLCRCCVIWLPLDLFVMEWRSTKTLYIWLVFLESLL